MVIGIYSAAFASGGIVGLVCRKRLSVEALYNCMVLYLDLLRSVNIRSMARGDVCIVPSSSWTLVINLEFRRPAASERDTRMGVRPLVCPDRRCLERGI